MDALRARFGLPEGTSSAALERVLERLADCGKTSTTTATAANGECDEARAMSSANVDSVPVVASERDPSVERVRAAVGVTRARVAAKSAKTSKRSEEKESFDEETARRRVRDAETLAAMAREDARAAQKRVSSLKVELRAKDGKTQMLNEELEKLRRENRALRHERVRATVISSTRKEGDENGAHSMPKDTPAALARAWKSLGDAARCGNAEVALLMRQYKQAQREKSRAFDKVSEMQRDLVMAREAQRELEARAKDSVRAYATAEAIIDEDADEKLLLRGKLKETIEELASLRVRAETQRDAIEASRACEHTLRDEIRQLEKQLVRAATIKDKYRDACHELEYAERLVEEYKAKNAHLEAECVMLSEMVREMRRSSGVGAHEFMLAAERALLRDFAPERNAPAGVAVGDAQSLSGYDTPEDDSPVRVGEVAPQLSPFVDDDFPSPPISAIVRDAATPDSSSSVAFHF